MSFVHSIVSKHLEEAAMLWVIRSGAVSAPHYDLADLAKLDGRIEAHLDGLRVAGAEGWAVCKEALELMEPGEFFTAGVLALESGVPARIDKVLAKAAEAPWEAAPGIISALGWLDWSVAQAPIGALLGAEDPIRCLAGVGGAAVHRQRSDGVRRAATSDHPLLRARGLKAAGEMGLVRLVPVVEAALADTDPACRFRAAWSGALLGVGAALPVLREIALAEGPRAAPALDLALRRLELPAAIAWQRELGIKPEQRRLAALAAGVIGDPTLAQRLIDWMAEDELARAAGEAFTMITGADLAALDLERKPPKDFQSGPTDDPKDESVALDADESLPWPDQNLVKKWWSSHQGVFKRGTRHLLGKPMTIDSLQETLRTGRQRQRAAAALELAIRQPGSPLANVAAPGFRQQKTYGTGKRG